MPVLIVLKMNETSNRIFITAQTNSFVRTFRINIIHDCGGRRCSLCTHHTQPHHARSLNFRQNSNKNCAQIDLYYMILNKNGNLLICHYMKYERMVISIIAKLARSPARTLHQKKRNKNTFKIVAL